MRPQREISKLSVLALLAYGCGDDVPDADGTHAGTGLAATSGGVDSTAGTAGDGGSSGDAGVQEPAPAVEWPTLACDPLVPTFCAFPYPSNVQTAADTSTATGRRVALSPDAMPTSYYGVQAPPTAWNRSDGFSTGTAMMVHLPGASSAGLAGADDLGASLAQDSSTVVLDAQTGERIAHFAELDAAAVDPEQRTLLIRPAQRLLNDRRYIVAVRGIVDAAGAALSPSDAFAALRDLQSSDEPSVDARRPLYADIFARLEEAGVARDDLQLAWDFTTASTANDTSWLLHMRDEGLAMAGETPLYTITDVQDDWDPRVRHRIQGTFEVPLFLDVPGPVSVMQLGDDGLPEATGTATFQFTLLVPASAQTEPAALLQFGHGLLGTRAEIERDHFLDFIDTHHYAIFATEWIGLAEPDQAYLGAVLDSGRIDEFEGVFARNMQAVLNALVLNRVVARGIATDPTYAALLDPTSRYYYGISLGGILGTLYMSLSTDVERGVVDVMGAPFGALLNRSAQFDSFFTIATATYPDARDVQFVLSILQLLWDRAEPNGYLPHLRDNPLPGTMPHDLLMRAARGDHSVSNVAARYLARSLGAPHVDSGLGDVFGLTTVSDATGLGYVEYDFGLPADPACNLPQRACNDPHGALRGLAPADAQLDQFLRQATIDNPCDGACSFDALGGCPADLPPPAACVP